jgi:hypothetical protein
MRDQLSNVVRRHGKKRRHADRSVCSVSQLTCLCVSVCLSGRECSAITNRSSTRWRHSQPRGKRLDPSTVPPATCWTSESRPRRSCEAPTTCTLSVSRLSVLVFGREGMRLCSAPLRPFATGQGWAPPTGDGAGAPHRRWRKPHGWQRAVCAYACPLCVCVCARARVCVRV